MVLYPLVGTTPGLNGQINDYQADHNHISLKRKLLLRIGDALPTRGYKNITRTSPNFEVRCLFDVMLKWRLNIAVPSIHLF